MKKKLIGIAAIIVAALFLLTPISAMSPIPTVRETTVSESLPVINDPSIIPQSEFVITLDENEEVIWTADYVTRDDDIAYVTVESDNSPQPLPLPGWYRLDCKVVARNWWGRWLFHAWARGWARFNWQGECTYVIDTSTGASNVWRYDCTDFESCISGGVGSTYAKITADGYFEDKLVRRYPHIHVWDKFDWYYLWSEDGYLEWDP